LPIAGAFKIHFIWGLGISNLGVGISDLGVRIRLGYLEMVGFLVGGGGCLVQVW